MTLEKIVSGGQTGADRAALDIAISFSIVYGGWCPKGRIDELGIIPEKYRKLVEISGNFKSQKENYDARGKLNIQDSDGTLIIVPTLPIPLGIQDGTLFTISEVSKQIKPNLLLSLSDPIESNAIDCRVWLKKNNIRILNIAGPRESSWPGIYSASYSFLKYLLSNFVAPN